MYTLLIKNIGQLLTMRGLAPKKGVAMSKLGIIKNAFVACEGDKIADVGPMHNLKRSKLSKKTKVIDARGQVVMPGLIDCHTHMVFAGDRSHELKMKLSGKSYLQILKAGGGILSTVKATRKASKAELIKAGLGHLEDMKRYGITTVEVKSGYGLDMKTELKILEVVSALNKKQPVRLIPTFLGAHTVPPEYKGRAGDYLQFLIDQVLPKLKGKAQFVDIFCEKGAFSLKQSQQYLKAVKAMGFRLKIHAEQINALGGAVMAAKLGALSCDHLDYLKKSDIKVLAQSGAVSVLLPLVPLYTREEKQADGRALIDGGVPVAVSTDFNPGSAPSKNIFLAMNLACLKMGLCPEEALSAVTINAAAALGLQKLVGSLESGKQADIAIMKVKDYMEIPYWLGENLVEKVIIGGAL